MPIPNSRISRKSKAQPKNPTDLPSETYALPDLRGSGDNTWGMWHGGVGGRVTGWLESSFGISFNWRSLLAPPASGPLPLSSSSIALSALFFVQFFSFFLAHGRLIHFRFLGPPGTAPSPSALICMPIINFSNTCLGLLWLLLFLVFCFAFFSCFLVVVFFFLAWPTMFSDGYRCHCCCWQWGTVWQAVAFFFAIYLIFIALNF